MTTPKVVLKHQAAAVSSLNFIVIEQAYLAEIALTIIRALFARQEFDVQSWMLRKQQLHFDELENADPLFGLAA